MIEQQGKREGGKEPRPYSPAPPGGLPIRGGCFLHRGGVIFSQKNAREA